MAGVCQALRGAAGLRQGLHGVRQPGGEPSGHSEGRSGIPPWPVRLASMETMVEMTSGKKSWGYDQKRVVSAWFDPLPDQRGSAVVWDNGDGPNRDGGGCCFCFRLQISRGMGNNRALHSKVEQAPDDPVPWLGLCHIKIRSLRCRNLPVNPLPL